MNPVVVPPGRVMACCIAVLGASALCQPSARAQSAPGNGSDPSSLKPVIVTDAPLRDALPTTYAGGQVSRGARQGALGSASVMDTPYSVTSYTSELIENQQARTVADVTANDASVRMASSRFNINEDLTIRGFALPSSDFGFNGMYGVSPYFRTPLEAAERVEVIKGPTALINGMAPGGSVGGSINLVPKRAGSTPLTRLTAGYWSDGIVGAHADIGRRFGPDNAFGIRVNGAYRKGDTPIRHQSTEETFGSLGLDYLGSRLRLSADVIYQRQNIEGVVRQFMAAPTLTALPDAPSGRTNYPGAGYSHMRDQSNVFRGEFDLADSWTVYAGYGDRNSLMNAVAGNPTMLSATGDYTYGPGLQILDVRSRNWEAGIRGEVATGPVKHKLTLGYTNLRQLSRIYFNLGFAPQTTNIFDPAFIGTPSLAGITPVKVPYNDLQLNSWVLADTLSFAQDAVQLTLGVRRQQVQQTGYNVFTGAQTGSPYDQSATSPMAALVFKPMQNLSLYASYLEGLSQGDTAPATAGLSNPGAVMSPYKSKQKEIGAKYDWGRLMTTIALFELTRPSASVANGMFSVNGEQRNRGVELTAAGEVSRGVRVLGGVSYIDAALNKTATGLYQGNRAVGVAKLQGNLGAEWDIPFAPGLTLTGRMLYTGSMYNDIANQLELPSWARFDIGARYASRIGGQPVTFRMNVENLANKRYWATSTTGYFYLGMPRTLMFSATVDL